MKAIFIAAGEGSRMLSNKAKSLQPVGGQSMLKRIYTNVADITHSTSFVVGFGKEAVLDEIKQFDGKIFSCEQKQAIGTADAVKSALSTISNESIVVVLYGDVPCIEVETIKVLISKKTCCSYKRNSWKNFCILDGYKSAFR